MPALLGGTAARPNVIGLHVCIQSAACCCRRSVPGPLSARRRTERMKANELHHKALQLQAEMLRERQAQQ